MFDRFVNNYGMLGVLDRLHGTDSLFRASKAYQRHIMLLGLVPLSQQIPDNVKQGKSIDEIEPETDPIFGWEFSQGCFNVCLADPEFILILQIDRIIVE